jgi:carbamoyl-phosphate synthase large subunit
VLLTSAGSLLGRGILSTLEGRRQRLHLVGADLNPDSVGAQVCDEAIPLPPVDAPDFAESVLKAVDTYGIDLVIPGRDPDLLALAGVDVPMAGPSESLVAVTRDKWATAQWCASQGIPFAPTVATPVSSVPWTPPLIAKPRDGSGSLGVRVLLTPTQVARACATPGLIIQPFLDPPGELVPDLRDGVPLFWEVACRAEYGVQALIGPNSEMGPWFCFISEHRLGRNEWLAPCDEPSLGSFAAEVVPQLAVAGFRGPVNVQVRRSGSQWQVIEINPRFSGGTSGRYLLGFDEVGWVLNRWLGEGTVPPGPAVVADEVVWLPQEFGIWR